MSARDIGEWVLDRIWPTLISDPTRRSPPEPRWPPSITPSDEVLELAYESLREEMNSEGDRIKMVEAKLLSILSLSPIAMAILVAMVTFLTGGRFQSFTPASILWVTSFAGYVALQFLCAVHSAIKGLERKGFERVGLGDTFPRGKESRKDYLQRLCKEITDAIVRNRDVINQKVGRLAVCHVAILNAVGGLLLTLLLLLVIVVVQQPRSTG